ncbi:MAG: class I SAM-dependent methyltransferase, partial [Terracidiphilus sp.]
LVNREPSMAERVQSFYDALAPHYHLIFDDWDRSIERQASVLGPLLESCTGRTPMKILDCACGIGTQAIGLAALGHRVVASDISRAAVDRSRQEARRRSLDISFRVSDMTSLGEIVEDDFDAVVAMDNALPHLEPAELRQAAGVIAAKLRQGGVFLAGIRDYDVLVREKPAFERPKFHGEPGNRRIVHQVWDWVAGDRYIVHLYITVQADGAWTAHHFASQYRCLLRKELSALLRDGGFGEVEWLMPAETGLYQPVVLARLGARAGTGLDVN